MYNNYLSAASELTKYEENASDQMGDSKDTAHLVGVKGSVHGSNRFEP
jgi:hypothetical protein